MGTSGIVYLGLTRREYCTIQFRTGVGSTGKISWIEKYFKVKKEKVDKMVRFLQGKGALMAFFAFLPAIGEVISIALGFMRSNIWLTTASMFVGKLIRYILLLYVLESAWNVVAG